MGTHRKKSANYKELYAVIPNFFKMPAHSSPKWSSLTPSLTPEWQQHRDHHHRLAFWESSARQDALPILPITKNPWGFLLLLFFVCLWGGRKGRGETDENIHGWEHSKVLKERKLPLKPKPFARTSIPIDWEPRTSSNSPYLVGNLPFPFKCCGLDPAKFPLRVSSNCSGWALFRVCSLSRSWAIKRQLCFSNVLLTPKESDSQLYAVTGLPPNPNSEERLWLLGFFIILERENWWVLIGYFPNDYLWSLPTRNKTKQNKKQNTISGQPW